MATATRDGLKAKYREVLVGFERYSWTEEQIYEARHDFDWAMHDLRACKECNGDICKTINSHRCSDPYWHSMQGRPCTDKCYPTKFRAYYALWHKACRTEGRPTFAMFECPGTVERKEQLLGKKTRDWWDK